MKASHKEYDVHIGYQTVRLMPGEFVFGRKAAAEELGMTERTVRTSLDSLSRQRNIAIKTTNKYSVITIINWQAYQSEETTSDQQNDQQLTNKRPATDQQLTTNKNVKNVENVKNLYLNTFVANEVVSDESARLADLLFSEIIKENSKSRLANQNTAAKEKTITGWALDIEKLIGIDKQEPSTVEEVIFFATHDDFWGANILSGKKLREKWDTLTMKMKQKGQKNGFTKPTGIEPFSDIPKALRGNW